MNIKNIKIQDKIIHIMLYLFGISISLDVSIMKYELQ